MPAGGRWRRPTRRARRRRTGLPSHGRTSAKTCLHAVRLEGLVLDQVRRQPVEHRPVRLEDVAGGVVGGLDQAPDLGVDARRHLFRVVGRVPEVAAEEHLALGLPEAHRAERLAHPVLGHHLAGDGGHALDVVGGAGRRIGEDHLFGGTPTEQHRQLVGQLAAGDEELVLHRKRERVPERAARGG